MNEPITNEKAAPPQPTTAPATAGLVFDDDLGGKAAVLNFLTQKSFPIPENFSLRQKPVSNEDWAKVFAWWQKLNQPALAVRSSAKGEDGTEQSFAGQFQTFLEVNDEPGLRHAIDECFASVERANIAAYASATGASTAKIEMRVLLQRMIAPVFAGVFFSRDPNSAKPGWLIEAVAGLGEQLVSGAVTPVSIHEGDGAVPANLSGWKPEHTASVRFWGERARQELGYEVDMEWAIDRDGELWVLQARPITTVRGLEQKSQILNNEMARIRADYPAGSAWDGQVFSEWTGVPSEMSFGIWAQAFRRGGAFDLALREVGFSGLRAEDGVVLDRLFGRGYLNLRKIERAYFGDSPYMIDLEPRPHLVFSPRRLTIKNVLRAPVGIYKMMRVAYNLQSHRKEIAERAVRLAFSPSNMAANFEWRNLPLPELIAAFQKQAAEFSTSRLMPTMLLTLLIEPTVQGLIAYLRGEMGEAEAWRAVQETIGAGLHSVASDMHNAYANSVGDRNKWRAFVSQYGHRGFGELELAHPRWSEDHSEHAPVRASAPAPARLAAPAVPAVKLKSKHAWKTTLIEQEAKALGELLLERERVKMEVMRAYAQLRWKLLKIAELAGSLFAGNERIFWLRPNELGELALGGEAAEKLAAKADDRRHRADALKTFELPIAFARAELEKIWSGDFGEKAGVLHGLALAPGLVRGRVHIVADPEAERPEQWGEETILVAEATDPGWTPLFRRAKALIVARGGALSHCAIVARELGLPAVSGIFSATHTLNEGEHVWVDGNHGIIRRER